MIRTGSSQNVLDYLPVLFLRDWSAKCGQGSMEILEFGGCRLTVAVQLRTGSALQGNVDTSPISEAMISYRMPLYDRV